MLALSSDQYLPQLYDGGVTMSVCLVRNETQSLVLFDDVHRK
jgi:hypothetical protein